jgi:hypothetical protein
MLKLSFGNTNQNVKNIMLKSSSLACATVLAAFLGAFSACAQGITFGSAQAINADANLLTNGLYVDAILPNATLTPTGDLIADGVTFHRLTLGSTSASDATFLFAATSGTFHPYGNNGTYANLATTSAGFTTVMRSGGLYMNAGATGAGTLTIASSALITGDTYQLQIFNDSNVGGGETTTFASANSVSLNDTTGQFLTGTFTATGANEIINFTQGSVGSGFTPVIGAVSLFDITPVPEPSTFALMVAGMLLLVLGLRRRRQSAA